MFKDPLNKLSLETFKALRIVTESLKILVPFTIRKLFIIVLLNELSPETLRELFIFVKPETFKELFKIVIS